MAIDLGLFERIARSAHQFSEREESVTEASLHPFDRRNIHPALPADVRRLFDNGHYSQATFETFKFVDKLVQRHSNSTEIGFSLMMQAFNENGPKIRLTALNTASEQDEQKGFKHLFGGGVAAIRNPRGHEVAVADDVDTCLDHLSLASLLIRRLEQAGFSPT